jgi:hypothetical protein
MLASRISRANLSPVAGFFCGEREWRIVTRAGNSKQSVSCSLHNYEFLLNSRRKNAPVCACGSHVQVWTIADTSAERKKNRSNSSIDYSFVRKTPRATAGEKK